MTRDSYLDITQIVQRRVCELLPRPRQLMADAIEERKPLLLLEHRQREQPEPEVEIDPALAFI